MSMRDRRKKNKRAIILLAAGHPMYGNWAYNLAISIHINAPKMPIILITDNDKRGISEINDLSEFYSIVNVYADDCKDIVGMPDFIRAKTILYDVSKSYEEFDQFLFLDADTLILPGHYVSEFFDKCTGKFAISCNGSGLLDEQKEYNTHWLKSSNVLKSYREFTNMRMYNVSSEVMVWKICDEMEEYWEAVKQFYDEPGVKFTKFGFGTPDEMAHTLALMKCNMTLDTDSWQPMFWEKAMRKIPNMTTVMNYIGFSCGGSQNKPDTMRFYNNTMQTYMNQRGIKHWWSMRNKRDFLPERTNDVWLEQE